MSVKSQLRGISKATYGISPGATHNLISIPKSEIVSVPLEEISCFLEYRWCSKNPVGLLPRTELTKFVLLT